MALPDWQGMLGMPGQREPSGDMRTAANSIHELYVALVEAGFKKAEALTVVGTMLAKAVATKPDE